MPRETAEFLSGLLAAHQAKLGTHALDPFKQAVFVLRWPARRRPVVEWKHKHDGGVHGVAERANSLLKTTFKALRRVSLDRWRIGAIVRAAHVLLRLEHGRHI